MNIHALIHTTFEKPGYIERWAKEKNHNLTFTNLYEHYTLPDLKDIDFLIVMGGPMGVYDEEKYPWLKDEKNIKQAVDKNKIILGICLGSQLIAEVLGAKVFPNKNKEIGWFNIKTTGEAAENDIFNFFPKEAVVFHWHGDTYNIPSGSVRLAESEACKNQAYIFNKRVIGLQFHLEITEELLNEMLKGGNDELKSEAYIQSEDEIRSNMHFCNITNPLLHKLLDNIEEKIKLK